MIFRQTRLKGAYVIGLEKFEDERGFFARTFCQREFTEMGLNPGFVQCNTSVSLKKGVLRGMHYQTAPHEEAKLVRCTRGAIWDVIIDLREGSETFRQWVSEELTHENRKMFYIPEGFAHGFLTLSNDTEVFYQMSEFFMPEYAKGVRWDDPAFGIIWPDKVAIISEKDRSYPDFGR
ncbi:MAG: dTDP-4-dehydrorhamnose 3,5-epimerase [Thermodesulfovibrionales bacterium]